MKKTKILALIFILSFSNLANPVFSNTNDKNIVQSETIKNVVDEPDMFAPIDLDLTDYTYMNKKNKK